MTSKGKIKNFFKTYKNRTKDLYKIDPAYFSCVMLKNRRGEKRDMAY
jgi:hypothetical protein